MTYKIFIERSAEKDLKKIPKEVKKKIVLAAFKLEENPRLSAARKIASSENYYRIRVGDYRIIYEISDKEKRINIFKIRHWKEAYLNL